MRVPACLLCSIAVLLAACGGSQPAPADPRDTPSSSVGASTPLATPSSAPSLQPSEEVCPDQEEIATDPKARVGGTLSGDVTGDGTDDEVAIASGSNDPECGTFVVVETGDQVFSAPLVQEGALFGNGFPRLGSLVRVDEVPGAEIVVDVLAGASTSFTAMFGFGTGGLSRYTIEGRDAYADMFPSGGSVGHLEATDCMGAARVVVSLAVPNGDGYRLRRTFFVVHEGTLTDDAVEKIDLDDQQDLEAYQEFNATPFGTCPA
jgi:hypothetical protein